MAACLGRENQERSKEARKEEGTWINIMRVEGGPEAERHESREPGSKGNKQAKQARLLWSLLEASC